MAKRSRTPASLQSGCCVGEGQTLVVAERLVLGAVVTAASSNLAGLCSTPTSPSTEELWRPWQQRGDCYSLDTSPKSSCDRNLIYRFMLLVFGVETLGSK